MFTPTRRQFLGLGGFGIAFTLADQLRAAALRRHRPKSAIMIVLGVLLVVLTVAKGGGPVSLGVILGVLFILAGVFRLRLERKTR